MNRVALYIGEADGTMNGGDLRGRFWGARVGGLRVVSVKREKPGAPARTVLEQLMARMKAGEFEMIMVMADPQAAGIFDFTERDNAAAMAPRIHSEFGAGKSLPEISFGLNVDRASALARQRRLR